MWNKLKDNWFVAAVIGILFALFKWEQNKRQEAEVGSRNAEVDKNDAVLAEKQAQVQRKMEEIQEQAEKEKGRKLTPEEMEEFLKKL